MSRDQAPAADGARWEAIEFDRNGRWFSPPDWSEVGRWKPLGEFLDGRWTAPSGDANPRWRPLSEA